MVDIREDYADKAIDQAKQSEARHKHGAIILNRQGHVIAYSPNMEKTSPVQAHYARKARQPHRINLHAEIRALIRCRHEEPHTLIVCRIDKKGNLKNSKPCPVCLAAIEDMEVENVFYSTQDGWEELG